MSQGSAASFSRPETTVFCQTIQNKLHFAATAKTAAELIAGRAGHPKPNMNLTTWKGELVRKADVTIAKNYLNAAEIDELNRIRKVISHQSSVISIQLMTDD